MKITVGDFCDLVYNSGEYNNVEYFFSDNSFVANLYPYLNYNVKSIRLDTIQETPYMAVYIEKG